MMMAMMTAEALHVQEAERTQRPHPHSRRYSLIQLFHGIKDIPAGEWASLNVLLLPN